MMDLFFSWLWWWLCMYMHMVKHQQTCLAYVCAQSLGSCLTLCHRMDCSPPGSSVCGILQIRVLQWDAMPSSRGSSQPRGWTWVSYVTGRFFTTEPPCSLLNVNYFIQSCFKEKPVIAHFWHIRVVLMFT